MASRSRAPAIDAGDPATPPSVVGSTDYAGNPRIQDESIDLGAYDEVGSQVIAKS